MINQNQLTSVCRSLRDHLFTLIDGAALAQLDEMHRIVQGWITKHGIDSRSPSLKVLLISARTARQNNLQANYFERLLGEDRKRDII
jgi:hypothetical protein